MENKLDEVMLRIKTEAWCDFYGTSFFYWSFEAFGPTSDASQLKILDNQQQSDGVISSKIEDVSLDEGVSGNCIIINGTTQVLLADLVSASSCLGDPVTCTSGLSVAVWLHISSSQKEPCTILTSGAHSTMAKGFHIHYGGSVDPGASDYGLLTFDIYDGSTLWSHGYDILTDQNTDYWNHVVIVWSQTSATMTMFVNGVEITSITPGVANTRNYNTANTLYLNGDGGTSICNARYDELALWENSLSSVDVSALYDSVYAVTTPTITTESSTFAVTTMGNTGTTEELLGLVQINERFISGTDSLPSLISMLKQLTNITNNNPELTSEELMIALNILQQVAELGNFDSKSALAEDKNEIRNNFLATVDNLIDSDYSHLWRASAQENPNSGLDLIHSMDEFVAAMIVDTNFEAVDVKSDNLELITEVTNDDVDIELEFTQGDNHVYIPSEAFLSGTVERRVIAVLMSGISELLNDERNDSSGTNINTPIMSVTIHPEAVGETFSKDVRILFSNTNTSFFSPECVFLDENYLWSDRGCHTGTTTESSTECICNHLTNFAVLMSVNNIELSAADETALTIITYVGCSLSLICLLLALALLLYLRELTSTRIIILKNLIVALMMAEMLFITGINATHNETLCTVVAVLLHYLYLAVFSWMLVQGVQLFMKIRKVFNSNIRVLYFCLFGWGFPAIVVGITLALDYRGYGTDSHCWLSVERDTIWAFVGPALLVILVNTVVLILVIKVFMSVKSNKDKTDVEKIRSGVRATALLLPLLGLTWAFGLLAIDESTVAFQYIFAILNSLQVDLVHTIVFEPI
uniref:Latrophilin-3-like n=1 Tax=Saccoglossus kowalevskii TaxID=10224 RepID=A0ABM0M2H8_SACKO|nr:PREDICTED: latrophilin-3-like [Saccoglossus kowalevskii]